MFLVYTHYVHTYILSNAEKSTYLNAIQLFQSYKNYIKTNISINNYDINYYTY
jgi:hypothetical protein